MMSRIWSFLSAADYIPHGLCLAWQPELIALHVGSDAAIAVAYYSIPFALIYFVWKRTDLVFPGLFVLSGAFILACGTTHVMSIVTLWQADYGLEGVIKLITALVSVASAFAIWLTMPSALALPSTAQLEQANRSLAGEIAERKRAQAALRDMNAELEGRVALRTTELQDEVAQRKRSEDALRRSEMYLAKAQRLSQTGSFGWDVSSGEVYWSDETFRIFECESATKPTVQTMIERTHPDDRMHLLRIIDHASIERSELAAELRLVMPGGALKHVRLVAHRTAGDDQGSSGVIGAVTDITEGKRAAEALRQVQMELAHANRVAALGQLTASIAHEVNQPVTGVLSSAHAALRWLDTNDPEAVRRALDRVIRDATRAGDVISGLRALVKKAPPRTESFDMNEAIREVIDLTRGEAAKNRVSLETQLAKDLPVIQGDRVQLQQVVLNLVINAIEAMTEPGDRPRDLLITTTMAGPDAVRVAVQDTGPGIDASDTERLFEAFYTTKPGGLGMGLSICRSIVEAHGGQLSAAAAMPHGTIFQVTIQIARTVHETV